MPRRDVVLTGIIAFAAGCAVGANWPKIRKKIGPMIGKAGFQISELGEFLSESFPESEAFFQAAENGHHPFGSSTRNGTPAEGTSPRSARSHGVYQNGQKKGTPSAQATVKKKAAVRRKKAVAA